MPEVVAEFGAVLNKLLNVNEVDVVISAELSQLHKSTFENFEKLFLVLSILFDNGSIVL